MLKKIVLILHVFVTYFGFSQIGGENIYQFLNLQSSPRQAALGGKVLTNVDYDVTQALYNPASINPAMDTQMALNYVSHFSGISYGTAAYAHNFDKKVKTVHAGVTYINYGDFDGYDENGQQTNNFSGNETALSVGYATKIVDSLNYYVGANVKFITSRLEQYTSSGVATDIALLHVNPKSKLHVALVFRNIGTQLSKYGEQREKLPFDIGFGISRRLENVPIRWHLTFDKLHKWPLSYSNPSRIKTDLEGNITEEKVTFLNDVIRHTMIGVELFPEQGFNLRLGYNFRRGQELRIEEQRNFVGLTAGFSIKLKRFRLSYTHAKYSSFSNSNLFGIHLDLKK